MQDDVVLGQRSNEVDDVRRRRNETLAAWEHFVKGDDEAAVAIVPPAILNSWYRCRDVHHLDPVGQKGFSCSQGGGGASRYAAVHALLSDIASAIVEGVGNCLTIVTDSEAQIVASRSAAGLRRQAVECGLEPEVFWSESIRGTNGMGTALLQPLQDEAVVVRGHEHWRQDMHEWTCVGVAVYDPVTGIPAGVLSISATDETLIAELGPQLSIELNAARQHLVRGAFRDAMAVTERFSAEAVEQRGAVLGLDVAGNLITTSESARKGTNGVPASFSLESTTPRRASFKSFQDAAAESYPLAASDPSWSGMAVISSPLGYPEVYSIKPVYGPVGLAGWILTSCGGVPGSDTAPDAVEELASGSQGGRVAALAGDSVVLLDPAEIRFAEASRHIVWLMTDCGRVRAAAQGMNNVARELSRYGFIRVHRSYLVNPDRVRRIHHKGHGLIALSTSDDRPEGIPVSRRSTQEVRRRLGL